MKWFPLASPLLVAGIANMSLTEDTAISLGLVVAAIVFTYRSTKAATERHERLRAEIQQLRHDVARLDTKVSLHISGPHDPDLPT